MQIYAGEYCDLSDASVIFVTAGAGQKPGETRLDLVKKNVGIFSSGTVLDTARLKYLLDEHLRVDPRSVHAFIIGEHGDSEISAWSSANVSGVPLNNFCEMRGYFRHEESMKQIEDDVKNGVYKIIEKKHATYYGIAMSVKRICEAIVRDERSVLPVSSTQKSESGEGDIALSIPVIVGKQGV